MRENCVQYAEMMIQSTDWLLSAHCSHRNDFFLIHLHMANFDTIWRLNGKTFPSLSISANSFHLFLVFVVLTWKLSSSKCKMVNFHCTWCTETQYPIIACMPSEGKIRKKTGSEVATENTLRFQFLANDFASVTVKVYFWYCYSTPDQEHL